MKNKLIVCLLLLSSTISAETQLGFLKEQGVVIPQVKEGEVTLLTPPLGGLWSVATSWREDWPNDWQHAKADSMVNTGAWTILYGKLKIPEGTWFFRDSYTIEHGRVKCIRRYEWMGKEELNYVTLANDWQLPTYTEQVMMPGINYYGNPSGYGNGEWRMPTYNKDKAPEAMFEEHRFPMPFVSAEFDYKGKHYNVALHSRPTMVPGGNVSDQWWSLGVQTAHESTLLSLWSGPVAMNGKRSFAKALQRSPLPYGDTYIKVRPGQVIEKCFYLETSQISQPGFGFKKPIETSLDLFKPFYAEDLPTYEEIMDTKIRFALSRWYEKEGRGGFSMYPLESGPKFVFGWCGQAAAPGYAFQVLHKMVPDSNVKQKIQQSLDLLSETPFNANGFLLIYDPKNGHWSGQDPLSQAQGMMNMANAIRLGRKDKALNTSKWEAFLRKACDTHAARILMSDWKPVSTNEGFMIAPLAMASQLFKNKYYLEAAIKATEYYAERHLSMKEPYWGGTLDAFGEDKEGAWAGFQGFMAMYEATKDKKYLHYAEHAAYVTLSYTYVWDVPMPASRLGDHSFKSRGWTAVSPQNEHIDVFGVLFTPQIYKLGHYLGREDFKRISKVMFRTCGQMIDAFGSHGEQLQHTNFAQAGDMSNIYRFRGGYAEHWTVFWITAHFLNAAAMFEEMGMKDW